MSKIAHYLQEHLVGEVTDSLEVRRFFAHDASILEITPAVVAYPANENDVRKAARFSWQLAQRGKRLPITARGGGTDTSGAAIGSGIVMAFTAHMNRILALDPKKEYVTVEPGLTFYNLQQTLYTHGLFLPPAPTAGGYATIGGGLANNSVSSKSVKYGDMRRYTEKLSVVLANGEIIETGPLNKRELNKKLGMATLEGEIYRSVDTLLEENQALIEQERKQVRARHNRVGYNIFDVKKKGSFDLTPLILGSQGSLGIITEATLQLARHNPAVSGGIVSLPDLEALHDILPRIIALHPSSCEMINQAAIQHITRINPTQLRGVLDRPADAIHLIVQFDDSKEGAQKKSIKSLQKLAEKAGGHWQAARNADDIDRVNKLKRASNTLLWQTNMGRRMVPAAEDVSLPIDRLTDFLKHATQAYSEADMVPVMWGDAGNGIVRMSPFLDLAQIGDRQKLFKISDTIYKTAVTMGGSTSGSAGDGRIRAPYMGHVYGPEMHQLMMKIKKAFDPYGIFNPGVKTASADEVKAQLRSDYSRSRHEHLSAG
ncbi:MAG TPA: FAD-binding oxidoreductase [Candidatus Saccharimonadales bacterium]|nr:FAD-binding oxidoreductase [Candidatus Saccharimonadales bacterium]